MPHCRAGQWSRPIPTRLQPGLPVNKSENDGDGDNKTTFANDDDDDNDDKTTFPNC
jgi:hypothetical protein